MPVPWAGRTAAAAYLAVSLVIGVAAAAAGRALGQWLLPG